MEERRMRMRSGVGGEGAEGVGEKEVRKWRMVEEVRENEEWRRRGGEKVEGGEGGDAKEKGEEEEEKG